MRINVLIVAAISCAACASESIASRDGQGSPARTCTAGDTELCACPAGTGTQTCLPTGSWDMCQCAAAPPDDGLSNPDPIAPVLDAGQVMLPADQRACSPGFYLGTYDCELTVFGVTFPLMGEVSFNLSINEMTVDRECPPSDEFCPDLVISENGGTLYGVGAIFYAFETMLQGALDCATGEFRAMGVDGRWGAAISSDPNDPDALWTIEEPPIGTFDGTLMGMHSEAATETISGSWDLLDQVQDIRCAGPFSVTLQP
jgi:hypothetical protein